MMKAKFWIFDSNALMSALLNNESPPAKAQKLARETGTLLVSTDTSAEYFNVFCRLKFEKYLSLETRIAFIENIISNALVAEIKEVIFSCRDPKDNMFLSLAVSSLADAIITRDNDLLIMHPFRNIAILSPADFLNTFKN